MKTPELLSDPVYHDEEAARLYVQEVRWPDGVYCPFCGGFDDVSPWAATAWGRAGSIARPAGTSSRCASARIERRISPFQVAAGLPPHGVDQKGLFAHQLHRTLGHHLQERVVSRAPHSRGDGESDPGPLGGEGKVVEADETFFGRWRPKDYIFVTGKGWVRPARHEKMKVMTLVERGGRPAQFKLDELTSPEIHSALVANVARAKRAAY